jgi:cytochrome c oxidase subunit 2
MRGQIVALPAADFARWLDGASATGKGDGRGLADRGHAIAGERGCLRCHSTDGTPFIGPTWAHAFGSLRHTTDGRTLLVDEAYLTESMMDPNAAIASGFQPVMPTYQGKLTPAETAAIVEYIRSLRDVEPARPVPPPAGRIQAVPQESR